MVDYIFDDWNNTIAKWKTSYPACLSGGGQMPHELCDDSSWPRQTTPSPPGGATLASPSVGHALKRKKKP